MRPKSHLFLSESLMLLYHGIRPLKLLTQNSNPNPRTLTLIHHQPAASIPSPSSRRPGHEHVAPRRAQADSRPRPTHAQQRPHSACPNPLTSPRHLCILSPSPQSRHLHHTITRVSIARSQCHFIISSHRYISIAVATSSPHHSRHSHVIVVCLQR